MMMVFDDDDDDGHADDDDGYVDADDNGHDDDDGYGYDDLLLMDVFNPFIVLLFPFHRCIDDVINPIFIIYLHTYTSSMHGA